VKPMLIKDLIKLNNFEPYQEYVTRTSKKPAKTSNIHSNFFAKRTGAAKTKSNNEQTEQRQTENELGANRNAAQS